MLRHLLAFCINSLLFFIISLPAQKGWDCQLLDRGGCVIGQMRQDLIVNGVDDRRHQAKVFESRDLFHLELELVSLAVRQRSECLLHFQGVEEWSLLLVLLLSSRSKCFGCVSSLLVSYDPYWSPGLRSHDGRSLPDLCPDGHLTPRYDRKRCSWRDSGNSLIHSPKGPGCLSSCRPLLGS